MLTILFLEEIEKKMFYKVEIHCTYGYHKIEEFDTEEQAEEYAESLMIRGYYKITLEDKKILYSPIQRIIVQGVDDVIKEREKKKK